MKFRHAASLYVVVALALAAFTGSAFAGNGNAGDHLDTRELLRVLSAFRRGDF